MIVKEVYAKFILDSRKEKTIFITIKTNVGNFSASSPNGKSKGKHEIKPYKKDLQQDIKTIKNSSNYFSEEIIEKFDDLRRIEDITEGHIGANTLFAFESAILKALAKEQKKEIWQLINSSHDLFAKVNTPPSRSRGKGTRKPKFPKLVGNCIGGGKHSDLKKQPDFQEFLLIPQTTSIAKSFEQNKKSKKQAREILVKIDEHFKSEKNDEGAWMTSLNEKQVLDILKKLKTPLGLDVAASNFFKRQKYAYENPLLKRDEKEQTEYLSNLIKNFNLFYIEDPFQEEDFESFSKLLKRFPNSLIVGDDLTVTNSKLLLKAIKMKSINAIIVKPNQCGSLLEVKKVCEMAKENDIKIIFSHRSGETKENVLADLAFGFGADFFKCGIDGKERESKIKRLIEIEKSLK